MSALVTAEEAQALLDDYAAGLMPDGPERPELARTVVAQASDLDGLRAEVRRADDERAAWRERAETAERERDARPDSYAVDRYGETIREMTDAALRMTRERNELRDAAREMLAALEAPAPVWDADESEHDAHAARLTAAIAALRPLVGDGATMRRDLPAEAVVVCPACGYGCTADLGDGGYVLRPHSRRETARVGLGGIVWCEGGTVRAR